MNGDLSAQIAAQQRELAALKSAQGLPGSAMPNSSADITKTANLSTDMNNPTVDVAATFTPAMFGAPVDFGLHVVIDGRDDGKSGASSLYTIGFLTPPQCWWVAGVAQQNFGQITVTVRFLNDGSAGHSAAATFRFYSKFGGSVA